MPFRDKLIFFNLAQELQNLRFWSFFDHFWSIFAEKSFSKKKKKNLSHTSSYGPITPDKVQKKLITQLKQNCQKEGETDSRTEKRKHGRSVQKCE